LTLRKKRDINRVNITDAITLIAFIIRHEDRRTGGQEARRLGGQEDRRLGG